MQQRDPTTLGIKGRYFMIIDNTAQAVGSSWIRTRRWGRSLAVAPRLNNDPTVNRPLVIASLLRLLRDHGATVPGNQVDTPPCSELRPMCQRGARRAVGAPRVREVPEKTRG